MMQGKSCSVKEINQKELAKLPPTQDDLLRSTATRQSFHVSSRNMDYIAIAT